MLHYELAKAARLSTLVTTRVSVGLSDEDYAKLDLLAIRHGVSRSALAAQLIANSLPDMDLSELEGITVKDLMRLPAHTRTAIAKRMTGDPSPDDAP